VEAKRWANYEAFLRQFVFPEEDRHLFTTAPWRGGFRWFRSPNIVPIEFGRQLRRQADTSNKLERPQPESDR
jgi:hypothetical protein